MRVLACGAVVCAVAGIAATSAAPVVALRSASLVGKTVVIDPGHNGGNGAAPGTIGRIVPAGRGFTKACDTSGTATNDGRLSEAAYTWAVARRLRSRLLARGARVVMTRADNTGVGPCINRRAAIGNAARADAVVSIHADGGPPGGSGFHVIYPASTPRLVAPAIVAPSGRLARVVRAAMLRAGFRRASYIGRDGLDARDDLGGLNLSRVPKVFVETGNMRNAGDAHWMERGAGRQRVAQALANGLAAFLGRS